MSSHYHSCCLFRLTVGNEISGGMFTRSDILSSFLSGKADGRKENSYPAESAGRVQEHSLSAADSEIETAD